MQIGNDRRVRLGSTIAVSAAVLWAAHASAQQIPVKASADAEVREKQPEFTRGNTSNFTSGTGPFELQISSLPNTSGVINANSSNRNLAVVRFSLPNTITSQADLMNYAEMRLFFRPNGMNGTGSIRVYGINPTNPLAGSWNEDNVIYRDAGDHQLVTPVIGNGQSLATPSVISQAPATGSPIPGVAGYNANSTAPNRTPGIRYENAPFSAQVEAENQARATYNANHPSGPLLNYINQPGYDASPNSHNQLNTAGQYPISIGDGDPTTNDAQFPGRDPSQTLDNTAGPTNDIWSDIPLANMPLFSGPTHSWIDDLDSSTTLIGYSKVTFPSSGSYTGQYITLGGDPGVFNGSPALSDTTPTDDVLAARQNLLNFLGAGLANGVHDFTFLVGPGLGSLNDPSADADEIINNANLQIASKEYVPVGGAAGDFAPELILAPEPGSFALIGLSLAGFIRRRRR